MDEGDGYLSNKPLFEVMDGLRPTSSIYGDSVNGKLRMSITDIYKEPNVGIVATGKVLSGAVMPLEQIVVQPLNLVTKIKSMSGIESHRKGYRHEVAVKGDNVQLTLDIRDQNDEIFDQIKVGDIISTPHEPLKLSKQFECKLITMKNMKLPICKGHHVIIHTQSVEKEAFILSIKHLLHNKTGEVLENKRRLRHIKADQTAVVTVKLKQKKDVILLDAFQNLKELSRITMRRDGKTIALGLVQSV